MTNAASEHNYKEIYKLGQIVQILVAIVCVLVFLHAVLVCVSYTDLLQTQVIHDSSQIIVGLQSLLYLASGVLFLIWQRRAFRNLSALNVEGMKNKEWYCLWGFFVPVACFVIPMSLMNEIWKASNPAILDRLDWKQVGNSPLVISWWTAWLGYGIPNLICVMYQSSKSQSDSLRFLLSPVTYVILQIVYCLAGLFLILIVRDISARQKKKHQLLPDGDRSIPELT